MINNLNNLETLFNSADDAKKMLKSLMKQTVKAVCVVAFLVTMATYFAGLHSFSLAYLLMVPVGLAAFLLQAYDIANILSGKLTVFIVLKNVFRLACFFFLLYVVLIKFNFSPVGTAIGLTTPVFVAFAVVFAQEVKKL